MTQTVYKEEAPLTDRPVEPLYLAPVARHEVGSGVGGLPHDHQGSRAPSAEDTSAEDVYEPSTAPLTDRPVAPLYLPDMARHEPGRGTGGSPYDGQASILPTALSDAQLVDLAYVAGWRKKNTVIAVAVALAESHGEVTATNHNTDGSTDYGPWQVNSSHFRDPNWPSAWTPPSLYLPSNNARAAFRVYTEQGWGAWSTYKSGAYLKYMNRARAAYDKSQVSSAVGNQAPPTSASFLGINTPNWLGGFNNPSVLGAGASAANAISSIPDFLSRLFQAGLWITVIKVLGGFILMGYGLRSLMK